VVVVVDVDVVVDGFSLLDARAFVHVDVYVHLHVHVIVAVLDRSRVPPHRPRH
jgi:hypothetical protein